jgi:hypothetical protein
MTSMRLSLDADNADERLSPTNGESNGEMPPAGLEPATLCLEGRCSIRTELRERKASLRRECYHATRNARQP